LPPAPRHALLHALWYRRSVRVQLLIVFVLIDLVAGLVAGAVTILKARAQTRVEIAASMRLSELLVGEAVHLVQQEVPAEQFLVDLGSQLRAMRHVRIRIKDAAGVPRAVRPPAGSPEAAAGEERAPAPAWFAALIASPIESRDIPIVARGQRIGSVEIAGEPRDEIAEVWENTVALGTVALLVNLAVIGILYVLFGRVLDPLTGLARGLADLEQRTYSVRLPRPQARELAAIADRFNALAAALEEARAENQRLNRRLITAQDDERRRTALDLHDEVGPSLFGLKANASSIAAAAAALPEGGRVAARAGEMLAIIEHLQATNRSLLNRLRPMALGHVPLQSLLDELVRERARQHPDIAFSFAPDKLAPSYGDSIDLTIYRCFQESMTNAIRHGQPKHVAIALGNCGEGADADSEAQIELTVSDDGCGIAPAAPKGFGIAGMRERVEGLGGSLTVEPAAGGGTWVRIAIPVGRPAGEAP
jgi:two-component system sensor histidine kinase UhpB